jgi:hypothetical protein
MRLGRRVGMAVMVMVVVLVVIVAAAGTVTYYLVVTTHTPSGTETTTHTLATITTGSASGQALESFSGDFHYFIPLGPFGIYTSPSGEVTEWNSTQTAAGSFTFTVDPSTYEGTGTGHGTITVATHGYCAGSSTVQYTFTILATWLPKENLTIAFEDPTPGNVTVSLACQGSTAGFNAVNNPIGFLSVYPDLLTMASTPANDTATLSGGITYSVSVEST